MNLDPIDFAPVVFAIVMSAVGLGFVKLLVYLHHRQYPRHGGRRSR